MAVHEFVPTKRAYSKNPKTGRPLLTWDAHCSCGWSRYTNQGKRHARQLWQAHIHCDEEPRVSPQGTANG